MKLVDCDASDMDLWLDHPCAHNVLRELHEWRNAADKMVHSKLSERAAGEYQMVDRVIRLLEDFRK